MTELIPSARRPVHRPAFEPKEAGRFDRHRDEIEVERLEAQLDALQADIGSARRLARHLPGVMSSLSGHHDPAAGPPHGDRVSLRDGSEVLIRPVEPADAPLLKEGFEHLGALSRFRRFLGTTNPLSVQDLRFLTDVDHQRHEALVAIDPASGDGVGIARYVRGDAAAADTAIVVVDSWQHRGVGELLADRLADAAVANGVEFFTGRMIVGNHAAEHLLLRVGEPVERLSGPGTVRLTVRLHGRGRS